MTITCPFTKSYVYLFSSLFYDDEVHDVIQRAMKCEITTGKYATPIHQLQTVLEFQMMNLNTLNQLIS